MKRPKNKRERILISLNKFKKRIWWATGFNNLKEKAKEFNLHGFKSCSKPCSCFMCKKPRYDRKNNKEHE